MTETEILVFVYQMSLKLSEYGEQLHEMACDGYDWRNEDYECVLYNWYEVWHFTNYLVTDHTKVVDDDGDEVIRISSEDTHIL